VVQRIAIYKMLIDLYGFGEHPELATEDFKQYRKGPSCGAAEAGRDRFAVVQWVA
jgi:hypothetical protein